MKNLAQVDISSLTYPGQTIQNNWTISELLTGTNLITFVFFIAGLIFFFNLLSAAWEYLLSTGDAKKIAGATQLLLRHRRRLGLICHRSYRPLSPWNYRLLIYHLT